MKISVTDKIDSYFSQFTPVQFSKDEIIIRPESEMQNLFLLKKGLVRMYVITEDGEEVTIHIFRPTAFFPIMLLLSNRENKYYFEAIETVEAIKAPTQQVIEFIKSDHEVLFDLTIRFADAITGLALRIEQLTAQGAYPKIVSLLLYLSNIFGESVETGILIKLKFNHDDIASWVGVARETVSRQIEKLEKKGLIIRENHKIIVKDLKLLQQEII